MSTILIALKEGAALFAPGSFFRIASTIVAKDVDGIKKNCYQLPDDAMGRTCLVDINDTIECTEEMLITAGPGHGRCNFSKAELTGKDATRFTDDFTARTIAIQKEGDSSWLTFLVPQLNKANPVVPFTNKVSGIIVTLTALQQMRDYEEYSFDRNTFARTTRTKRLLHYVWDLSPLEPGFYAAEIQLDKSASGIIHFIKHFPVLLNVEDRRKTKEIHEPEFSEEIWNGALEISIAWGPEMSKPFHVRLLDRFSDLTWAEANYLEKLSQQASSFAWRMYEQEADRLISIAEASTAIGEKFPWINSELQRKLRVQGEYYAKMKR